jgi:hypothetical protein
MAPWYNAGDMKKDRPMTDRQQLLDHLTNLAVYIDQVRKGEQPPLDLNMFIDEIIMIREQINKI